MKDFLISQFDTESEREEFLKLYNFEMYRFWLCINGYISTLDNLKAYKNFCYNCVMKKACIL